MTRLKLPDLAFLAAVTPEAGANVVTNGLQLYLDAGNTSSYPGSGTTWTDLSGSNNHATLVNGVGYSSGNGGTLVFDGVNDYITTSFATTSGQAVTYCGWLYSTETTSTYRNFVDSSYQNPMIWWDANGKIEFDAGQLRTISAYRNQWVFIALSKPSGSSSASYYVNGVLAGTGSSAYSVPTLTPYWLNRQGGATWKGNCSVILAYDTALTGTQITQNFDAFKARYGL